MERLMYKVLWWISGYLPVAVITYSQMRNLAEDLIRWEEIAYNRQKYPIGNEDDRRESIVYGNCLSTIQAILGRRRVLKWMKRYGAGKF